MNFGGKSRNHAEQARFDAIKQGPCLACWKRGKPSHTPEVHHLLSGGIRRGHLFTIGLCCWHHRAFVAGDGSWHKAFRETYGPSLAEGSKKFHAEFGSDDELLALQERIIPDPFQLPLTEVL
ncbi:MAG: Ref family recombination enhancement nuclease [Luteimonas sp.]